MNNSTKKFKFITPLVFTPHEPIYKNDQMVFKWETDPSPINCTVYIIQPSRNKVYLGGSGARYFRAMAGTFNAFKEGSGSYEIIMEFHQNGFEQRNIGFVTEYINKERPLWSYIFKRKWVFTNVMD
jgi:hypothetical protein